MSLPRETTLPVARVTAVGVAVKSASPLLALVVRRYGPALSDMSIRPLGSVRPVVLFTFRRPTKWRVCFRPVFGWQARHSDEPM